MGFNGTSNCIKLSENIQDSNVFACAQEYITCLTDQQDKSESKSFTKRTFS